MNKKSHILTPIVVGALMGSAGVIMASAAWANKYTPCVDYYHVGLSDCGQSVPSPTTVLPPSSLAEDTPVEEHQQQVQSTPVAQPKTLDQKIDDFMEDHGKPPREFVAFHLEPSLENALKWVHAFNKMQERNKLLTRAWTQAEALYTAAQHEGQDVTVLRVEDAPPEVPDFGIPVPGLSGNGALGGFLGIPQSEEVSQENLRNMIQSGQMPELQNIAGLNLTQAYSELLGTNIAPESQFGQSGQFPGGLQQQQNAQPLIRQASLNTGQRANQGNLGAVADAGVIKIDYYFSAECPYCSRFEPQFQSLIKKYAGKLDVTCVDATPSGRTQENINGKVDCSWRPVRPGEITQMGIKATPSLIINRGNGKPMERVSGYVEGAKLESYLFKEETL